MYEKFFGYPYPFSKYDQIFCAEYNMVDFLFLAY